MGWVLDGRTSARAAAVHADECALAADRAVPVKTTAALDALGRPGTLACTGCDAAETLLPILAHGHKDGVAGPFTLGRPPARSSWRDRNRHVIVPPGMTTTAKRATATVALLAATLATAIPAANAHTQPAGHAQAAPTRLVPAPIGDGLFGGGGIGEGAANIVGGLANTAGNIIDCIIPIFGGGCGYRRPWVVPQPNPTVSVYPPGHPLYNGSL
ncbi:DUF6233 domain-containing protein [Streptomyces sp. NPDC127112]|uniref:DUF6233 domain-containing protein n=1 Tax=Streptomyces sp. NPDC127112 TaxID=3345364 RepID=UPI00363C7BEE